MQEVASAAGLHRATVHRHFASRDDLIATLRRRAFDEALAALREARLDEGSPPDALLRGTRALMEQAARWQVSRYSVATEATPVTREIDRLVSEVLARGQQEGSVRSDVEAEMLALMWRGMLTVNRVLRERDIAPDVAAELIVR